MLDRRLSNICRCSRCWWPRCPARRCFRGGCWQQLWAGRGQAALQPAAGPVLHPGGQEPGLIRDRGALQPLLQYPCPGGHQSDLGRFVVNAGQAGDVTDQLVQQCRLQLVRLVSDQRLLGQHDLLGSGRVSAEQAPIDKSSVPQVGVLALLGGEREDLLDQLLGVVGLFRKRLQLDLTVLVMEGLQETLQQFIGVVNPMIIIDVTVIMKWTGNLSPLSIFSDDPDHACPGLGLVQSAEILAQLGDDALNLEVMRKCWDVIQNYISRDPTFLAPDGTNIFADKVHISPPGVFLIYW